MAEPMDDGLALRGEDAHAAGYAFAERLFIAALVNGRDRFLAEPKRWERLARFLDAREVATVKSVFAARPPRIRAGYATSQDPMPTIAVALASEAPESEFLAELLDVGVDLPELGMTGEVRGSIDGQTIDVTIYADHPDVTLYLYHWTKYVLRAHVPWLIRHGVINPAFVRGGDVQPGAAYAPERLFIRQQTWKCSGESASVEPIPDPPRGVYIFLQGVIVDGVRGGVNPTLAHDAAAEGDGDD